MSQESRLLELLKDGKPHSTNEIVRVVYGLRYPATHRIAARINSRRERLIKIDSWLDKQDHALLWYQLLPVSPNPPKVASTTGAGQGVLFEVKPKETNQWD